MSEGWTVVLPVKRLPQAKTRIVLPAPRREELALAMASDTVRAALASRAVERVMVVTSDRWAADALRWVGAEVVPDAPDAGLNQALGHGIATARDGGAGAVAVLSADLPAATAGGLDAVLAAAAAMGEAPAGVVGDKTGTGTTVLAVRAGNEFPPLYGEESLRRHLAAGAADLTAAADAGLRCDVDTVADLMAAVSLGVGPATGAVVAGGWPELMPLDGADDR